MARLLDSSKLVRQRAHIREHYLAKALAAQTRLLELVSELETARADYERAAMMAERYAEREPLVLLV